MDFAKALSLIKQIIHEISDMHIKILEICIYMLLCIRKRAYQRFYLHV